MANEVGKEVSLGERDGLPIPGVFLGVWAEPNKPDEPINPEREWFWNLLDNIIVWRVPEIRECIAAPSGYRVMAADYSQIEVKLMAFLSQDPG